MNLKLWSGIIIPTLLYVIFDTNPKNAQEELRTTITKHSNPLIFIQLKYETLKNKLIWKKKEEVTSAEL